MLYPVSDVIIHCEQDCIEHYGIPGQKWGVRRFQNADGTLTPEGKKRYRNDSNPASFNGMFDYNVNINSWNSMFPFETNRSMMRKDIDGSGYTSGLTTRGSKLVRKAELGKELTDREEKKLQKEHDVTLKNNFKLRKRAISIIKHRPENSSSFSSQEKDQLNFIADLMKKNREALESLDKAKALNEVVKYEKEVPKRLEDPDEVKYIDPSYRTFNTAAEKAKAEADYLNTVWKESDDSPRANKEITHIFNRLVNLSVNAYDGVPHSDRTKELYDESEGGRFEPYMSYRMFTPKYQNTEEYKDLLKKTERILNDPKFKKASDDYYSDKLLDEKEANRLYKEFRKAMDDMHKKLEPIESAKNKIRNDFQKSLVIEALKDIGYTINDTNIELAGGIIFFD